MDDRSKLVKSLSADELRRLMEKLKKGQGAAVERIGRAPRDGAPLQLSFAQERLWFLDHLGAGAAIYNVPAAVRLTGRLGAAALRHTFEEIVRRHEALRTTFDARDGVPFQVIAEAPSVPLPVADLSALPAAAREREMRWLATEEAVRPFDLLRGPLLRAALVRLGSEEHVLALTIHHIVSDGWSVGVLIREMAALYDAFCAGRPSPLPELPVQYADYAVWQRRRLSGETLEKELAFWRARLAGTPPLELPTDRLRTAAASFHGGHRPVEVAAAVLPRVHALAREAEGTLNMILLAAFETLLLRYSGQTDFAIGTPVANRNRSETEGLIGFFVNTLALRSSLAEGLTFRGLLRRVREGTLAAFAHEEMPFDKLVEELQPEREAGRNPLFQVVLTLQNQPRPELVMGGLGLGAVEVETGTAKFDLTFSWGEEGGRLLGSVEYSAALFDGATAERLGRHFATLLIAAAANPGQTLWELPLLDEAERRQTLIDWNRTARPYPGETPVHELFAAWAERTPQAVAVEFGDARLTYAELDGRANRLAHRLRRLGVGPEELVVLAVPRSLEMIEGMVGILKAGGAYLPLDPTQPRDRLAFLVEESRPAAVVTLEEHLAALPDFGARAVCLDRDRESLAGELSGSPRSGVTADNLVYVLYTSGSTGRPKAVAVPHRGLVRLVAGADYARLDASETFFQFAPLSFDPSTLEIFGALANGGRLAVAPTGPFSLAELGRIIRRHGVTTLWLTSGLFHQMIEEGLDDLRGVRQLLSGGDVLSPPHIRRALEALPGVELIDGYGPTENSCFTTCYRVDRNDPPGAYVPIGKPMANTTVYILDREMRPVPVGVPGELLTGGDGLARGYRGRPELTAERFVPSPFAGDLDPAGARLYRTGDLARFRPDGNVEFLGRMDSQVKIRGYRIEPGEVETVLAGHPALAECAVVVRREESGEKRLVAFYVPSSPVAPADLKEHLGASLPAYMIPSAFVEMAELPLTVSGKVDRRALSRLEAAAGEEAPADSYVEPRTDVERQIAAIWRDLLGRERIGVNDSFFDLGGHSLLATRVLSRLRETLRADLSLAVVFERPTLAGLAGAVEEALGLEAGEAGGPGSAPPPLGAEERGQLMAWRRSPGVWALPGTAHGLFEEQARLRPEAVALVAGERSLSYGELARRSGALARSLRWLGVGPEVRVGLSAERSLDLVVGILGVLRAGGALVPLDPAHPEERLALLLADSGLSVVVAQEKTAAKLPAGGPPVVLLEGVEDGDWSGVEVPEQALAYVIYTSGSTGRPKGVGVSHASLVPMLRWSRETFGLKPGTRVLQSLSYAFDFGLWEILTAVVSGAALHVPPTAETGDAEAFARRAAAEGIDVVHATPSFFRAVAETGARLEGLRVLHLGGEALSRTGVERLAAAVGAGCTLYNGYGPTEVTVNSLLFEIGRPRSLCGGERMPIGRPSAENAAYVVDPLGGLVPVGVSGELWVGGAGVARGYLGRPDLTAEKFIPDGFSGEAGGRLYRTGDLVRWLPDSTVEFLGRVDHQVKIRGFRIEPGEIEAVLRRHPQVREAVVVPRERPGGAVLVAYVAAGEPEPEIGELREFLRERLPAALVPSAFVRLAELPLTPTGKVDRRALPEPDFNTDEEREAPRTPEEMVLARIFEEVLGVSGMGRTDSFFDLGGHSLLATRVVSRVRKELGADLPLRVLFESPNVAGLAERLAGSGLSPRPIAEPVKREGGLPLSFAQERLWFLEQLQPGTSAYNIPMLVRLRGSLSAAALAGALREVVRRHQVLRVTFGEQEGEPAQWVAPETALPFPVVDLSALPEARREPERARLADREAQRPFDLARGPIARALLFRLDPQEHVAILTLHHIVADGWSMAVLVGELLALYQAALAGSPSPLPELTCQYLDFARWQRDWLQGETLEGLLAYWRQALAGLPEALELPTDRPRPPVRSFRGRTFHLAFGAEVARALNAAARETRTTLFMTLLAGFGALLTRYGRQADLAVGSPIAGRNRGEYEGLIGFFVNTLVLRVQVPGDLTFQELLAQVRQVTLGAYEHQDLPFERIVAELQPERILARSPLFQVSLALQNNETPKLAFPGLTAEPVEAGIVTAKFDLSIALREEGDRLTGMAEYAIDLFDEPTVRRLVEHLEVLLAAATAAPRTPLAELPLLTAAESRQLLERSAGGALPPRIAESLGRLFADPAGLEGFRLYILDLALQPVPHGVPGEVCVGGTGLAQGHLERPELTAERLVPDPFATAPGGRLYRTGELARYRTNSGTNSGADGDVEFVERPAPTASTATRPKRYVAPRTPIEKALAAIWQETLGLSRVGREDDFFDLGGHSLLVTRVAARVRSELGATLSVRQMFEAPTLPALAAAVEAAGGAVAAAAPAEAVGVTRRPPGDHDLPLSFPQERLWFLDRLDPGAPFYNIAVTLRLSGRLDIPALAASFDELLRRHEALRTAFVTVEGQPRQRVLPFTRPGVPLIDLSDLPLPLRDREAERVAQQYADWRFDLTRGPMLVAALLRLEPEVHHCAAVFHHIASDGWSIGIFFQEIAALYPAFLEGRPSPLPELPIQYPDYALWQRRAIAGTLEREVAYWLERLSGEIAPLELPIDRPRPAVQSYRGRSLTVDLPPALGRRLNELSRREGATLFMTLLATAKVLFHRWSGQDDILVGAPIAGRRMVETEGLIGFFLNTLVLRTDLSGNPSFRELLERVRAVTLGAYSHQDVPFEALLARLPQQRDPSRTPLFQVMFNMLNLPVTGAIPLPGLTLEPFAVPELPSKFDLTFYVTELPDHGLFVHLLYNADLFAPERMADLLAQLTLLLEQVAERPETPVEALSLVTPAARAVLPDPAAPLDGSWVGAIHDLFSARARTAPERPAVSDREGTWSYGELETASNRLAHRLLAAGVRQGDRVAVWAHRSAPVAAAVLGALKAGAAFTMLDPAYPPARLVEILKVATPRALVRLEAGGPVPDEVEIWLIEAGCVRVDLPRGGVAPVLARLEGLPGEPPAVATGPDDVAVLGFTSGSTGTPKGIAGRHGPLTHFLPWQCERFGLNGEDRFSLLSGLAHDPLQRDLFTPLYLGATIVVPDPEDIGVSGRLAAWVAREGVTVAHLTPAMGQILTERPTGGAFVEAPGLRLVLLVGDALTRLDVARIRRLAPRVTCVNLYGSTETQRAVAYHVCAGTGDDAKQVLPLGAGMRDVQLLLTNRAGGLAGIGEVGEIAVRSPHLAKGYLGDEALTADKFRTNPFTGLGRDRIYRTGDLGRYLPDGEVAFAGRADQQVKIRGFRIEPAEIEARLAALPGVREAVVVAREDRGETRLVAYIVVEGAAVSPAFLRQALRDRLPAYMMPSAFVLLERLPITPNGKVDRRALPAPVETAGEVAVQAVPESAIEEQIAAVWREVLGVERVGVTDNFFDVGGHSLLLVRLHSRLQEALGREISLMELFNHPNIRSQADHLAGGRASAVTPARDLKPEEPAEAAGPAGGIAIVGMAGRFPQARDLEAFWRNLRDGVEAISFFSHEDLAASGFDAETLAHPGLVKARGVMEDEAMFDADFFDIPPRQAELMDPQLRHFLECSWEALESAGYDPARFPSQIGVFGGMTTSTYFLRNLLSHQDLLRSAGSHQLAIATDRDFLTTQVSYKLNLRGPSVNVQTACSTSLVAVHLAAMALLAGECDMALAGGVSIKVPQVSGYVYHEGGLDSSDGHTRSFDARADGTVYGGGVGIVVLKRLEDALVDGDTIHAVILGSAINNDGAGKVGYTAPSLEGESRAVADAQAAAGVAPETIGYVECHGSATGLGDAIEVAALARAFATDERGRCPIGSVKTNIGHLGAAAGAAALIKTVLALEHGEIPPSLHFETPNPQIDFVAGPFYVNTRLTPWPAGSGPRRAGVSSFGIGGTNAHLVLEQAPEPAPTTPGRPWQLLLLSARSRAALDAATANLARWLERHPEADLADVAYTLQTGRQAFSWRRGLVCRDAAEARRELAERAPGESEGHTAFLESGRRARAVFLLPGEGAADPDRIRDLYDGEPAFRSAVDRCRQGRTPTATGDVFAVEYALAQLWISWGVRPEGLLGQGTGAAVAACLAGILALEDALRLTVERARWIEEHGEADPAALADFLAGLLAGIPLSPPLISCLSGAAATWSRLGEPADPAVLAHQLAKPVQLPGALADSVLRDPAGAGRAIVPCWPRAQGGRPASAAVMEALSDLWLAGVEVDWSGVHGVARRRRLPLPTYPFERRRFWIEPDRKAFLLGGADQGSRLQVPAWRRTPLSAVPVPLAGGAPLLLVLTDGPAAALGPRLSERLAAGGRAPARVVQPGDLADLAGLGLLAGEAEIVVVSSGLHELSGGDLRPEHAALLAACHRMAREHGATCRGIDLPAGPDDPDRWAALLAAEIVSGAVETVAYGPRGQRWVRSLEEARPGRGGLDLSPGGFCFLLAGDGEDALADAAGRWLDGAGVEARRVDGAPELPVDAPAPLGVIAVAGCSMAEAERRLQAARELARRGAGFCLVLAAPGCGPEAEAAAAWAGCFALREAQEPAVLWRVVAFEGGLPSAPLAAELLRQAVALGDAQVLVSTLPGAGRPDAVPAGGLDSDLPSGELSPVFSGLEPVRPGS